MLPAGLTSEEKLLIALCRLEFNQEQVEQIRKLASDVKDWDHFTKLSNDHGIIALCRENIRKTGIENFVPKKILEMLQQGFLKSLARNTYISGAVEKLNAIAKKEAIKIVLLKGAALEKTLYGNQGLRQMNDVDILVKPEDALRFRNILISAGYESAPMISKIYEKHLFVEGKHLPELIKNGLSIEIHFKLFDQKGNSLTEELYLTSTPLPEEKNILIPEPALHFLYLVKHLAKHERDGESQLRLYADLSVLLEKTLGILNEPILHKAKSAGIEEDFNRTLDVLHFFWHIPIPEFFEERGSDESGISKFIFFLLHPKSHKKLPVQISPLKPLNNLTGLKLKILFVLGYVFPSVDFLKSNRSQKKTGVISLYFRWWIGNLKKLTSRY